MSKIEQTVRIEATPNRVFQALTRADDYRGWWSKNCAIAEWEGGECLLHFIKDGNPVSMRFRVDAMDENRGVQWTCLANDAPPWVGTTVAWRIEPAGAAVDLHLDHAGWSDTPPPPVAQGWQHFTASLKAYVETGTGSPW